MLVTMDVALTPIIAQVLKQNYISIERSYVAFI